MSWSAGAERSAVDAALTDWRAGDKAVRLWNRDATLWTGSDESKWLAWLGAIGDQLDKVADLEAFQADVRSGGFTHALLIGMGGSSLGPEVLAQTFGPQPGYPVLHVLDSTDPTQIRAFEAKIDLAHTLFIVSSKSGSTLEPNILKQYFFERVKETVGADLAGSRFVAVTDPGSKMQEVASKDRFRRTFFGDPGIGGRYSVLSNFGTVPGAAMGLDLRGFLENARTMMLACGPTAAPQENPGVLLGCVLGALGRGGRDKLTVVASPGIADFGAWLEQLVAESTGKLGHGIIPLEGEPLGEPSVYGNDRVFAYLRLDDAGDSSQDSAIDALERAGHPVIRIGVAGSHFLGQEFFRWEIATATAGAILGINPFDQPDVEASKVKTRALTEAYEKTGALPSETPILTDHGIALFADQRNADALAAKASAQSLDAYVAAHLARLGAGDYCALLAYIEHGPAQLRALTEMRRIIRDRTRVATCVGFGPRFLHSTGQAYKGGPNSGVFLQVTCEEAKDLPVPGQRYSFGIVKAAQARGDFDVLAERGRRALRVHLGADVDAGLMRLFEAVERAMA
jgi:transaldolase/glucose-6-phosphate isomerase